jgi:hypothetical protein
MIEFDVVALAREAGICFPDCHFLDANPYEYLLEDMSMINNEEERNAYLELARQEEASRHEKMTQLRKFAGLIVAACQEQLRQETADWHEQFCQEVGVGARKACTKLQWMASDLGVAPSQVSR